MKKFLSIVPRWLPALFFMMVIFAFSSRPGDDLPNFLSWDFSVKKTGHAMGYGLLALSYFHLLKYNGKYYWLAWIMALAYAATDEFHQSFVAGRNSSVYDVLVFDNLGAVIMLWLHFKFWRKEEAEINQL